MVFAHVPFGGLRISAAIWSVRPIDSEGVKGLASRRSEPLLVAGMSRLVTKTKRCRRIFLTPAALLFDVPGLNQLSYKARAQSVPLNRL